VIGTGRKVDITVSNLSILKTGKAEDIRFSMLEKICKVEKLRRLNKKNMKKWCYSFFMFFIV